MNGIKTSPKDMERDNPNRFIPQEDYLQSLYVVTKHWESDIEFLQDELNFFKLLIDKHLVLLIDPKNIEKTRSMVSHVIDLEKDRALLEDRIQLHIQHLADLVKDPFIQKVPDYREEHAKLEVDFPAFVQKFRHVKSEVFKLTEWVIHSDKIKRVIDWV